MKYSLILKLLEEQKKPSIQITEGLDENEISIDLFIPRNMKLKEVFEKESLLKLLKNNIEYLKSTETEPDEFMDDIQTIEQMLMGDLNILPNCNHIMIEFDPFLFKYINENEFLQTKTLHIAEFFSTTREDLNRVTSALKNYTNVLLTIDGNQEEITIQQYKNTVEEMEKFLSKIKKYKLSPLEQMMYAYDLVRDRVYTEENQEESYSTSRDLTSTLLGDKIVCVGYANIFEKILQNLGIQTTMCSMVSENQTGHRRNAVYVKDSKYHIEGVFFCDPTWDSKKDKNDNSYLDSYRFFCKNQEEMRIHENSKYTNTTFAGYNKDFTKKIKNMVKENGIESVSREITRTINEISNLIDQKQLIELAFLYMGALPFDFDALSESLDRYEKLFFDSHLSTTTLLKIMRKVRKIEYYENPEKYPFTEENFKNVAKSNDSFYRNQRLITFLFGDNWAETNEDISQVDFEKFKEQTDLEKEIGRVKLTKVLSYIAKRK